MRLTKLKLLAAVLAVVGLFGVVAGGVTQWMLADPSAGQPEPAAVVTQRMPADGSAGQPGPAGNDASAQNPLPPHLPPDIVAAWIGAGAEVGWMRRWSNPCAFFPETEGKAGDLPAFRFARWPAGRIAKLPAPASAFGLCVRGTEITDAGLKELAGLPQLEALDLTDTQVTWAGLKELVGLKQLRRLSLGGGQIRNGAIQDLGRLQQLRELHISPASYLWLRGFKLEMDKVLPHCHVTQSLQ
jgi:hypothetical protein